MASPSHGEDGQISGQSMSTLERTEATPSSASEVAQPAKADWARQLSNVNVDLNQHLTAMPSLDIWDKSKGMPALTDKEKQFAMDRTFKLSQAYLEVLNGLCSRFRHRGPPSAAVGILNEPMQLMVLSGYTCLIEIYDQILQHLQACARTLSCLGPTVDDGSGPMHLPSLRVGDFKLPSSSSTHIVVTMHLMETMMHRLHDLIESIVEKHQSSGASVAGVEGSEPVAASVPIIKVTADAIRVKEQKTLQSFDVVRRQVTKVGII